MKVVIAALLYTLLFVSIEILTKKAAIKKEVSRKLVHIVAGVTAAGLPFFMSFHEIIYLGLLFIPVMFLSKKRRIFTSIHEVSRRTHGEVYFPLALVLVALLFPVKVLYVYGVLVMALSDGFASVIGQKYGRITFSLLGSKKSYMGSGTFHALTFLIGLGAFMSLHGSLLLTIVLSFVLAGLLTVVEAALSYGLDNLILPPLAAFLLWGCLHVFKLG